MYTSVKLVCEFGDIVTAGLIPGLSNVYVDTVESGQAITDWYKIRTK